MGLLDRLVAVWKSDRPLEQLPDPRWDRRQFLKVLSGSVAVAAAAPLLDLEALVWTPSSTIVVPGVIGNSFVTLDWITREALRVLERNLTFVKAIDRTYDAQWIGDKVGSTTSKPTQRRYANITRESRLIRRRGSFRPRSASRTHDRG